MLHFFTDLHEDYHRTTDDWQKINVEGFGQVAGFVTGLVTALANRPGAAHAGHGRRRDAGQHRARAGHARATEPISAPCPT